MQVQVTGQPMTTMQPMQPMQVTTIVTQPNTILIEFQRHPCCCGCDALCAAKTIAILGFIFAIIGLISLIDSADTYFSYSFGYISFILQVGEVIAALLGTGAGMSATFRLNEEHAKYFMYYWLVAIGFVVADLVVIIIWCLVYPILWIWLWWAFPFFAIYIGLFVWFYNIAKVYYLIVK